MRNIRVLPDVRAIHHENDRVTARVVALPQVAHGDLAADIPDLQVHIRQRYRVDILPYGGHCLSGVRRRRAICSGLEEGFDLREERCFAGVI